MSGINVKKLRNMQKDLNDKSGGGESLYIYSNKLPEEMDIRILPPPDEAAGSYFVEQECWWVNGKIYLSNSTEILGLQDDVINEEIEAARATGDATLIALIDKKKKLETGGQVPLVKKEYRYLIPVLQLDAKYDDNEELVSLDVEGHRVLVAKVSMVKEINKIVTNRQFQNKTKNGVADREKGYNIIIGKTGKGLSTEYSAIGWNEQSELDEKYYEEKELAKVDAWSITRKQAKSQEYLRSVIRNYLYGEEILEDGVAPVEEKEAPDELPSRPKRTTTTTATTTTKAKTSKPKKAVKPQTRSLLDDAEDALGDLDD